MKQRSTTPVSKGKAAKGLLFGSIAIALVLAPLQISPKVGADKYDDQIRAVQREIDEYQANARALSKEADTLSNQLSILSNEKSVIQSQINSSEAKHKKLENQIVETNQKIEKNRDALGDTIADMYLDDNISPLEMLASSKNIGDYVDQQEYRSSIQNNLNGTIKEINVLKKQLEDQKKDVERVLADQTTQHDALAAKSNEQSALLADTQGQESAYQQLSAERSSQINSLRAQQAAELASRARQYGGGYTVSADGSNGGYPSNWANAPMNAYVDTWGMYSRQCVSYVAFKVSQVHRNMPYWGGIGNANEWPRNARAAGIPVGTEARKGAVGVVSSGTYGHVAWVEEVYPNGKIRISHYNVNWTGNFAVWDNLDPSYFDTYIYF